MATDYDCWRSFEDVNVEMVIKYMQANSQMPKACRWRPGSARKGGAQRACFSQALGWCSQGAVKFMTKLRTRPEAMKKVDYLFPGFWES